MPLNNAYDEQAVIQAIASALETFYGTLIEKIDGLNIQKVEFYTPHDVVQLIATMIEPYDGTDLSVIRAFRR